MTFNKKIYCVCLTKQGWYDVGTDLVSKCDPYIERIIEGELLFEDASAQVSALRAALLVMAE